MPHGRSLNAALQTHRPMFFPPKYCTRFMKARPCLSCTHSTRRDTGSPKPHQCALSLTAGTEGAIEVWDLATAIHRPSGERWLLRFPLQAHRSRCCSERPSIPPSVHSGFGINSKNFYGLDVNSEFHLDLYILRIIELPTAK